MKYLKHRTILAGILFFCWFGVSTLRAEQTRFGPVDNKRIESPHPHPRGRSGGTVVWSHTLGQKEAIEVAVFFSDLRLGAGDELLVYDGGGSLLQAYDATAPPQAIGVFPAGTIELILLADDIDESEGVTIDFVGYRLSQDEEQRAICGTDDRKDMTCFKNGKCCDQPINDGLDDTRYIAGQKVARLTMVKADGLFNCTGFMINHGNRNDLLMTNSHCVEGACRIIAEFRAEYGPADCASDPAPACTGTPPCDIPRPPHGNCDNNDPDYRVFEADRWWGTGERCDAGCDWGLVRFPGNPGAVAGIGKLTLRVACSPKVEPVGMRV